MTTTDPQCPLCHRARRGGRPLCNQHMQRVGPPILDAYFARKRAAIAATGTGETWYHDRLAATEATMRTNAARYDAIRDQGVRPIFNRTRNAWDDPRERARTLFTQYGLHQVMTLDAADALIAELYPLEETRRVR